MEQQTAQNASFTILRSYYDAFRKMDDSAKLQYIGAIMAYGFDGIEPDLTDPMADMAFTLIRPTLENSVQYHAAQRGNGMKGGRPKKKAEEKNPNKTQQKPKRNPIKTQNNRECESDSYSESDGYSESESYSENDSDNDLPAAKAAYVAPQAQRVEKEECSFSDFEKLWQAYPRKEDRQAALEKYFEVNLPSSILLPVVEAQKAFFAKKKHPFIPKLATWLELGMYSGTECVGDTRTKRIGLFPETKNVPGLTPAQG